MRYELCNTASDNRLARSETREAALEGVAKLVDHAAGHRTATGSLAIPECANKRRARLLAGGEAVQRLARSDAGESGPATRSRRHAF